MDMDEEFVSFSSKQMDQLRKELFQRLSQEKLDVLDDIFTLSQEDPATFHKLWIQPLLDAGLDFKATFAKIVDSYVAPN